MMSNTQTPNQAHSEISLATIATGIVAAVLFLLISSFVSSDTAWATSSSRIWNQTTFTVDDIAGMVEVVPNVEMEDTARPRTPLHEGHAYDALYRSDFMTMSAGT